MEENQGFTMNIQGNDKHRQLETWIGLARVEPRLGNSALGSAAGAVAPVLALAADQDDFVAKAVTMLNACEFDVLEIEDIEPFAKRVERYDVASDIVTLAASLTNENPFAFGTFQSFAQE
jgi:hypothetical protein